MRYLIVIAALLYFAAVEAQAENFASVKPSFVGVNINNPLLSATAGVQFGYNNKLDAQQSSHANFVGVQQVAIGKPGSSLSNSATVGQTGNQNYTGLGQHIETLPLLPLGHP
jgi:hypothetical protein